MNILLLNAHSSQNAGDLAILEQSIHCLRTAYPQANITVTINDEQGSLPKGVSYIPSLTRWLVQLDNQGNWRWRKILLLPYTILLFIFALAYRILNLPLTTQEVNQRKLLKAYYQADLIAVIGGGHLYARHKLNISFIWLWVGLAFCIVLGKPLIFLPQSFGPLPGNFQRGLLSWLLNRSTLTAAREYRSLRLLHQIGVTKANLVLPDLAFAMDTQGSSPYIAKTTDRPIIGLTLMDWGSQNDKFTNQANYEAAIIALISLVQQQYKASVYLFAQCTGPTPDQDDRRIARRLIEQLPDQSNVQLVDAVLSPSELQCAYQQLDMLIATRMHSAIFALNNCVPTLMIGYLHKSAGLMEQLSLPNAQIDINQVNPELLTSRFEQIWQARQTIQNHLQQRIPAMRNTLAQLPRLIRESVGK